MIQIKGSSFKSLRKIVFIIMLQLVILENLSAQYNIDSIKKISYSELKKNFEKSYVDTIKDLIYANIYLEKAKKDKDTVKIADGYLQLSNVHPYKIGLLYADSSIIITKKIVSNKNYPARGYLNKGIIYYYLGDLKLAIEQYVIAQQFAEKNKNESLLAGIKVNIGLIKNNLGEKEEALVVFKDYVNFIEKSEISNKEKRLARGLFALADTYIACSKYDSADLIIKRGIDISLQKEFVDVYADFLNLSGISLYHTKNYVASKDSILKGIKTFDLQNNISFALLYLGKSTIALKDTSAGLYYFLKVDSFLCNNDIVTQELLEAYPPIIEYYKRRKNYAQQLHYTSQLIRFDSIIDAAKTVIGKDIEKKYDIPLLLTSKEKLINQLNKEKKVSNRNTYLLLFFSVILTVFVVYYLIRNRKYKKRFEKLLNKLNDEKKDHHIKIEVQPPKEANNESTLTNLDHELIKTILNRLDKFEKSKRYTNSSYTLNRLAKELKTNSSYLSKIINDYKGQNFPNYMKKLRINLAVTRLKNEPQFRDYTIQAIAEEVGFKTAQSFSVTFHEKTGLYPSYFIKQLVKQNIGEN